MHKRCEGPCHLLTNCSYVICKKLSLHRDAFALCRTHRFYGHSKIRSTEPHATLTPEQNLAPGPRPQAPGPRPQAPGPRPQAPGPRPQAPGPRLCGPTQVSGSLPFSWINSGGECKSTSGSPKCCRLLPTPPCVVLLLTPRTKPVYSICASPQGATGSRAALVYFRTFISLTAWATLPLSAWFF